MQLIGRTLVVLALAVNCQWQVECAGMEQVFGWKQMDYYNRGGDKTPGTGGGSKPSRRPGGIIFPDQLPNHRYSRAAHTDDVITSRDQPSSVKNRFANNINNVDNNNVNASYIPYNNVPMGATHFNGRLFITMPRRRVGIPSTLNYIDMHKDALNPSPKLHAYPNFETNYLNPSAPANPNRLISVYRTTVDACKRLWFIDTGMLEYPDNRMQVQRPSIWVIDLTTDRVLNRFEIPVSIVATGRGLASIAVDVKPQSCQQAYAYIPDLVNSQLYVYSLANNRIWSFSHNYFNFDPLGGDLNIGGQNFRWNDGIFSTTLGALESNGYRKVYFHAMASSNEFVVNSQVLQNEANAARSDHGQDFRLLGSRGTQHQSTMHEYDPRTGIIFYDEIQRNGVGCWNTNKPFSPEHHDSVMQDAQRMIYPSDLTIDEDGNIWIMSNSMPIFIYSNLDANVVNFRVWKQNVYEAAKDTACEM